MQKSDKIVNFLDSTNNSISKEASDMIYSINHIRPEKCELYSDFIQSLFILLFDTYLGDGLMNNKKQLAHFKWCWNTNKKKFEDEGINIENEDLFNKFMLFALDVYYPISFKDNPNIEKNILNLWKYIFDYNLSKSKADLNTLVEYYTLFEKGLNKK